MATVQELYQEIIIDHNEHPHNEGELACPTCTAEGFNASCGDEMKVALQVEDSRIIAVKFQGEGCAISRASGSMMTDCIRGMTLSEAMNFSQKLQKVLQSETSNDISLENELLEFSRNDEELWDKENYGQKQLFRRGGLGDLEALLGVRQFPMRIKCATLAWHTLESAIKSLLENPTAE